MGIIIRGILKACNFFFFFFTSSLLSFIRSFLHLLDFLLLNKRGTCHFQNYFFQETRPRIDKCFPPAIFSSRLFCSQLCISKFIFVSLPPRSPCSDYSRNQSVLYRRPQQIKFQQVTSTRNGLPIHLAMFLVISHR